MKQCPSLSSPDLSWLLQSRLHDCLQCSSSDRFHYLMLVSIHLGRLWSCTQTRTNLIDSAGDSSVQQAGTECYWPSMDLVTFRNNGTEVAAEGFLFVSQGLRSRGSNSRDSRLRLPLTQRPSDCSASTKERKSLHPSCGSSFPCW